jgi:hypothetical protein
MRADVQDRFVRPLRAESSIKQATDVAEPFACALIKKNAA